MRHRSSFYTSLGRLLMIDLLEDEDKFDNFMIPLTGKYNLYVLFNIVYLIKVILINFNFYPSIC